METMPTLPDSDDKPDAPDAFAPPPLPVLGGYASGMMGQQAWTSERHIYEMKLKPGRQGWKDVISEYRTGTVSVGKEGVTISGKAVLPNAIRIGIQVVCLLLVRFLWIIAYIVLEYAIRRDRTDMFTWDEIDAVLVEAPKNRVCIIYHFAAKPKSRFALGLLMEGGNLEDFLRSVRSAAPEKIVEGKVGAVTPFWYWVAFIGIVAVIILVTVFASSPRP